ncbi:MAG TPA: energy transducer TonB [Blastocatellia bacterium]|jgi:TonB family protein|nr:energy transducer TonB [Blastocatellia bacterium]
MKENALLLGTLFEQPSLFIRLKEELTEAASEFRQGPKAYLTAALRGDTLGGSRRKMLLQFGIATGIVFYAAVFAAILVFWTLSNRASANPPDVPKEIIKVFFPGRIDHDIEGPKDKDHATGGGGGGDNTRQPASEGQPPISSREEQVIAPSPDPQLKAPALPVIETIKVDERVKLRTDDLAPTGLSNGVLSPPDAGPGSDRGMGTGDGGGGGSGRGRGFGPGSGWNIGGEEGGRPGRLRDSSGSEQERVDTRPVPLNRPRPNYTEAARKNKIQGVIRARALVGADGTVKQVVIVHALSEGLNEEAILAVYQMHFRAATRSGQSVASWITLEVEFNLR